MSPLWLGAVCTPLAVEIMGKLNSCDSGVSGEGESIGEEDDDDDAEDPEEILQDEPLRSRTLGDGW